MYNKLLLSKSIIIIFFLFLTLIAVFSYHTPSIALIRFLMIILSSISIEYFFLFILKKSIILNKNIPYQINIEKQENNIFNKIFNLIKNIYFPTNIIFYGFIIFLLTDPNSNLFKIFLTILISTIIKHFIRYFDKLIVNPVASGLFISSLFGLQVSWWGLGTNYINLFIVLIFMGYFYLTNFKQPKILLTYILFTLAFSFIFTFNILFSLKQLTIPGFWFFALVLFSNNETIPNDSRLKVIYSLFVSFFAFLLPKIGSEVDPLISSLTITNLIIWVLNIKFNKSLISS